MLAAKLRGLETPSADPPETRLGAQGALQFYAAAPPTISPSMRRAMPYSGEKWRGGHAAPCMLDSMAMLASTRRASAPRAIPSS